MVVTCIPAVGLFGSTFGEQWRQIAKGPNVSLVQLFRHRKNSTGNVVSASVDTCI